jgi:hypothetical protein
MNLARQCRNQRCEAFLRRRDAEARRKTNRFRPAGDSAGGRPSGVIGLRSGQSLPVQVAEEAEGAEEKGACRNFVAARDDSAR